MLLRDDVLSPIPGNNPAGQNLRHDTIHEKIREALREEDPNLPVGIWSHQLKKADFPLAIRLAGEALGARSKDLEFAVYLAEALLRTESLAGLTQALNLSRGLLEKFWDSLYPEIEEGDLEYRAAPLERLAARVSAKLKFLPLTRNGLDWFKYSQSRSVGYEKDCAGNADKLKTRKAALAEGKISAEDFDQAWKDTPKSFYEGLAKDADAALESLSLLQELCDGKFADVSPNFGKIRDQIEEIRPAIDTLLQRKIELEAQAQPKPAAPAEAVAKDKSEPAPAQSLSKSTAAAIGAAAAPAPAAAAVPVATGAAAAAAPAPAAENPTPKQPATAGTPVSTPAAAAAAALAPTAIAASAATPPPSAPLPRKVLPGPSIEPADWEDVVRRIIASANYARKHQPHSPVSYLMLRALRWGELRAKSPGPDPLLMEAPTSDSRQQLKRLILERKWQELLEAAETAMSLPSGRAWLDVQRYTLTACRELGSKFDPVLRAIVSELRALLADFPDLPRMTLLDDSASSSEETQSWLKKSVLLPRDSEAGAMNGSNVVPVDAFEMATQAVHRSKVETAIEIMTRQIGQETSGRGRFQRRVQLAQICVSNGLEAIAMPMLQELAAEVEKRKLEDWEPAESIAQPLALLFRCLQKLKDSSEQKQKVYHDVCRLDPVQALQLTK